MLLEALSTARDLGRLQDIASVLIRHGLGDAVRRLGLARIFDRAGKAINWKAPQGLAKDPQLRLREALEELGPTFVKVGQMLSARPDLLPPTWTDELAGLQQHANSIPYEDIREQLVEDLGAEPEEVFSSFDQTPLAAASIAQVHRATLLTGEEVILKIRRPGIREVVEADLRLITRLAERMEERLPELRRYRPRNLIRQFGRSLRNELDLRIEAKNAERLRDNLPEDSGIVVPRIFPKWTRERLCVMEYLEGSSLHEWLHDEARDEETSAHVAELGCDTILRMVFVDGCFHADPHPGNILLLRDGRLGLVDFGMVGFLPETRRSEFLELLVSVINQDLVEVVDILTEWSDGKTDTELLSQDCAAFIERYNGLSLEQIDTTEMLGELTTLLRENDLFLPGDVALLLKVFITLDGLGRTLAPDFVMATHVEPFAKLAWEKEHSPLAVLRRSAKEAGSLLASLPGDLKQIMHWAKRGKLHVNIDVERLERFGQRLDHSANRLTVGIVTAALIIGTSICLTVSGGPRIAGMPLFGLLGFGSSLVGGVCLLWSILRSPKV